MEQIDTLDWTRVLCKVRKTKWRRKKVISMSLGAPALFKICLTMMETMEINQFQLFDDVRLSWFAFELDSSLPPCIYMLCYALHFMLLLLFCFLCKLKTESHSLALQWRLSETPSALLCDSVVERTRSRIEMKSKVVLGLLSMWHKFFSSRRLSNFHFEVTCSRHTMGKREKKTTRNNENENDFVFV